MVVTGLPVAVRNRVSLSLTTARKKSPLAENAAFPCSIFLDLTSIGLLAVPSSTSQT